MGTNRAMRFACQPAHLVSGHGWQPFVWVPGTSQPARWPPETAGYGKDCGRYFQPLSNWNRITQQGFECIVESQHNCPIRRAFNLIDGHRSVTA
jgi:hypothetical protein